MSTLPPPLLRRRSLLPGESLPSLLMRLAKANHYDPPSLVTGLALAQKGDKGRYSDISRNLSLTILERLTALTKIDPQALYSSIYHRFAPTITPPDRAIRYLELTNNRTMPLFTGGVARGRLRPEFAVQYCPECLRSSTYHRLIWFPIAVAACLDHKCILINSCPQCGKSVTIKDIFETYCSECNGSLIEAQTIQMHFDAFGLFSQRVIQSWILDGEFPHSSKYLLLEQPVNALYRFIDGLRINLMQVQSDWSYLHRASIEMQPTRSIAKMKHQTLTPYQSYCLYATAMKALVDWPEGFYDFLDAYRMQQSKGNEVGHAVAHDLGNLYQFWIERYWQNPIFTFVQEAFNHYLVNKYSLKHEVIKLGRYKTNRDLMKRFTYISVKEASKLLHIHPNMIKFLIQSGRLTKYESQDAHKYLRLDRSEVLALQVRWLDSINLKAAAELMGVPNRVIPGMVRIGLLEADLNPSEGAGYWRITKSSVTGFMETLAERCCEMGENTPIVKSFTSAAHLYKIKSGLETAHLLLQATMGCIRIYHQKDYPIQVRSLFFDSSDINTYLTNYYVENGWVDTTEAIRLLRTSPSTFSRWVEGGLLVMAKDKLPCAFERRSIEEFLANHIKSKAAAEILGIGESDVRSLAHQGFLKTVSGPTIDGSSFHVFRRDTLLQWKNDWLTFNEATKLLQVEESILSDFVKSGLIVTLKPRYGKFHSGRLWYSKQSILELQEKMRSEKA